MSNLITYHMFGSHNICIGPGAGSDLTTESYQFCFATAPFDNEYRTEMSKDEFAVVDRVVRRALANKIERDVKYVYNNHPGEERECHEDAPTE